MKATDSVDGCNSMNLIEHLIQQDAIGSQSKRSTLASEILRKEITSTVAIYPQMRPAGDSTSDLIRRALMEPTKPRYINALDSPKHKAELVKLAAGKDADFEVLNQIEIFEINDRADPEEKVKPVSRSAAHEKNIIGAINGLKYVPTELPKQKQGKPGVKSEVRKVLGDMSNAVFVKAWARLLKEGSIAYKE